jgi:hypothetical protein
MIVKPLDPRHVFAQKRPSQREKTFERDEPKSSKCKKKINCSLVEKSKKSSNELRRSSYNPLRTKTKEKQV